METRREPVRKFVGGIAFDDPYAWLQEESEEALAWQKRRVGEAVDAARSVPFFAELVEAIKPHLKNATSASAPRRVGGRWFSLGRNDAGTAQAVRVSTSPGAAGSVVVDAADLAARRDDGRPVAIMYAEPSPDGRLVAFSASAGGDMTGVFLVADVATCELLDVDAPVALYNLPLPGWLPDGSGFYLQDRAADGRHQIRFIPVAPGAQRRPAATFAFDDVPPNLPGLVPQVSPGGTQVVAVTVPHEHLAAVIGDVATGYWRRFAPEGFEGELHGDWLDDDTYVAIATDAPRGRIVAIPAATSNDPRTWRELVAPSDLVLRALRVIDGRLVVASLDDVALDIRIYDATGSHVNVAPLPPFSAALSLVGPGRVKGRSDAYLFTASTFTTPSATYALDLDTAAVTVVGDAAAALEGIAVHRHFATSADGTRVPYFVVARDDVDLSTPQPTLVNAYGGFNAPWLPSFLGPLTPFVEAGGVFVCASLRGGSEYGRDWYYAGRRHEKQHVFDDLRAVAEDLIQRGQASPQTLACWGSSNGGLLAGVAITQQPELWRVVIPQVPLFDMLEPLADAPGAEAIRSYYLEDYGNPDDPADAAVLRAYSPYHNVVEGTAYPAVFSVFGEKDLGCPPFHGRKFTAALLHATTSGHPVLLRVWDDVGHGSLDPQIAVEQCAEWLGFVMHQLGMSFAS